MQLYLIVEAARDPGGTLRLVAAPLRPGSYAGARRRAVSPDRLLHYADLFEPTPTAHPDHASLREELAAGCLVKRGEVRAETTEEALASLPVKTPKNDGARAKPAPSEK